LQDIQNIKGLSAQEVNDRIQKGFQNKASLKKTKTITQILVENVFSVFNIVILSIIIFLLVCYFIAGDVRSFYDSIGTAFVILLNTCTAV